MKSWGNWLLAAALLTLVCCNAAMAAPDRFDNQIPDAVPDPENTYNLSFSTLSVNTDGPITSERSSHQLLRLGYQFSDKLNASFHFNSHDLAGGIGLTNPIFSNLDSAQSYGLRLEMNLLNEPATPAGPDNNPAWVPGSAFSIGFLGNIYNLDRSGVGEQETEVGAFLAYSTDLTEEMRGHTYFSTSRLTGDNSSGSLNRVGAGLDYLLNDGERPLVLMANGLIDIYNFRQPQFNTSRISRFDLGLRYRMSRQWDAQLGWSTFNDSEQDSSGSGLFAGINWRSLKGPCTCGTCENCSNVEIHVEQPPAQAQVDNSIVVAAANLKWNPEDTPLMELDYPQQYDAGQIEQGLHDGVNGQAPASDRSLSAVQADAEPEQIPADSEFLVEDNGIAIPVFPESRPLLQADGSLMVRPARTEPEFLDTELAMWEEPESDTSTTEDLPAPAAEAGLQAFIPLNTPADAQLSRAPARHGTDEGDSDGITDACSRFLFLRVASVPRRLLASNGG